ncbi:DsrE family protein [Agarilytica rhodophyticola]|uniref:DsrE family protein n=1 Tax=Agarilytica rhodophyticola TaxID=1737490 RepID=UPI000B34891C|nr:DsrE family protein [Agarilytica rhodophyticola]
MSSALRKNIVAISGAITLMATCSVVCNSEPADQKMVNAAVQPRKVVPAEDVVAKNMSIKAHEMEKMEVQPMPAKAMPSKVMPYDGVFSPNPDMSPVENPNGYLARIMLDSPEEVEKALLRAEELYKKGAVSGADNPLAFVLHGPEVQIFFKDNYEQYKSIVDLAARLSAFKVVDVKVCSNRLDRLGETEAVLPAFVETVPFGPQEVERLIVKEKYVYF